MIKKQTSETKEGILDDQKKRMREAERGLREWWVESQGEEDFLKGSVPESDATEKSN